MTRLSRALADGNDGTRTRDRSHRVWRAALLTVALGATYGCGGGLSCGSNSGCLSVYPFPQTQASVPNGAEFVDDGVRMRMTQDALDFLSQNIRPLLQGALGSDPNNPDNILISSTSPIGAGNFTLAQGEDETHPTEIYINARVLADTLEMEFVGDDPGEPDGIRIFASDVPVGFDGRLFTDFGLGNAACDVFGTNSDFGGYPYVTSLTLEAIIRPRVGNGVGDGCDAPGECLKIDVEVTQLEVGSFGAGALELDKPPSDCGDDGLGPCSEDCSDQVFIEPADIECDAVCFIEDVALDFISAIAGFIIDLVEGFLPALLEGAIRNALDDVDGSPLAASGRVNLGDFAPGVLPASALDMGFAVGPTTGAFDVNDPSGVSGAQGMDLIFKSGFEAAPPLDLADDTPVPHPCVRHIEGNDFAGLYGAFQFEAPDGAVPLDGVFDGQVYHLGASLAQGGMNQALFAAYNSGGLCIEASTDSIHALTGGAFPFSAAIIDTLASGKLRQLAAVDAPVLVALAPSQPPVLTYGEGTEDEGHLIVDWPGVEVNFYVLMNERFSRIFAVSTDISMQLTVFNDPATGTLRIAVVDGPNVENFTETYNELLPGVAFTEILETLIGSVFDAALGDGLEFDFDVGPILSDALGGAPVFVEFRGIETTPAEDRQFLNVYLGLTDTLPQPRTADLREVRLASESGVLKHVVSPVTNANGETRDVVTVRPTGEVRIESDDMPFDGNEYFARVDFGAWRGPLRPTAEGVLVVRDPKLRIIGEHTVFVRARIIGEPNSLQAAQDALPVKVWVDAEAPRVELTQVGDQIVARGWDVGTRVEDLRWQWQLDDGDWSGDASDVAVRSVFEIDARRIAVRAVDGAGNVSKSAGLDVVIARKRVDEEAQANRGCAQAGLDGAWLGALTLLSVGALVRRRRRRRR